MARRYEYEAPSKEEVHRRQKQSDSKYDSIVSSAVTWFKPKSGENRIRLVSWFSKTMKDAAELKERWGTWFGITITVHNNVGPNEGTYLCLDKMAGEPCPICDAWRGENIEKLATKDRILCWFIDRSEERVGPKLWSMPLGVSKDISIASEEKGTGKLLPFTHPEDGYDLYFDKEGEKDRTQYKRVSFAREPSNLGPNEKTEDKWLDFIADNPLPDMLELKPAEYLEKILAGQKTDGDGDNDRDSSRSDRRRRQSDDAADDREETSSRSSRSRDDDDNERGGRRRRDADDGDREETSTRRGRAEETGDDDSGERTSRRRRGDDDSGDETNSRSSRRSHSEPEGDTQAEDKPRRRRVDPDDDENKGRDRDAESDNEGREARSRRGKDKDDDGDADRSQGSARERLRNVGRRR